MKGVIPDNRHRPKNWMPNARHKTEVKDNPALHLPDH
jgi:hypothetical protein